jgi:hypothetical protein
MVSVKTEKMQRILFGRGGYFMALLERIWKEATMAYSRYYRNIYLERWRKTTKDSG